MMRIFEAAKVRQEGGLYGKQRGETSQGAGGAGERKPIPSGFGGVVSAGAAEVAGMGMDQVADENAEIGGSRSETEG